MLQLQNVRIGVRHKTLVSFDELTVDAGERVGIVGESGSGKTLTVMSVVGLLPPELHMTGSIRFDGKDLGSLDEKQLSRIRGRDIGVVFQDPAKSLNPTMRIGKQIAEAIRIHRSRPRSEIRSTVLELIESVQLPAPDRLALRYPHELSGGQQQRVMIAMAISCGPKLLIADEPTTALDVTVQQGVLELLVRLSREHRMSLLFVSHNLGVVQAITDRVVVMQKGSIVEVGPTRDVIDNPQEEYTKKLIDANPDLLGVQASSPEQP